MADYRKGDWEWQACCKRSEDDGKLRFEDKAVLRQRLGRKRSSQATAAKDISVRLIPLAALDWDGKTQRANWEWLLLRSKRLRPVSAQQFSEPRQFGGVVVHGLADAVAQLKIVVGPSSIGRGRQSGCRSMCQRFHFSYTSGSRPRRSWRR